MRGSGEVRTKVPTSKSLRTRPPGMASRSALIHVIAHEGASREMGREMGLDQGINISLRCVMTLAAFAAAVAVGGVGLWLGIDVLTKLAMVFATAGFMFIVLNDNAKTRSCIRIALDATEPDPSKISRMR